MSYPYRTLIRALLSIWLIAGTTQALAETESDIYWKTVTEEHVRFGKDDWHPMLAYVLDLHKKSTHPPQYPFSKPWEEIGPGYVYGPAFGHWDIVHQILDVMPVNPKHAYYQLLNNIENQEASGLLPGSIWMPGGVKKREKVRWNKSTAGHPPMWVKAVHEYQKLHPESDVLKAFFPALVRQLTWFENARKADDKGFYYNDILYHYWESGVDEGVRFDETQKGKWASIDATSHVFMLYQYAHRWAKQLGFDHSFFAKREAELKDFIQNELWVESDSMFYDIWSINDESLRHLAFENFSPLITGSATREQAARLIDLYLLNEQHFLTEHPVPTVAKSEPKFEKRMWRGPAWNSMTYWIALGCVDYGRPDAAKVLLERALDMASYWFEQTGEIWEFYDSLGGSPENLARKPHTDFNQPSKDYLGHNPLIAMAALYDQVSLALEKTK